MRTLMPTLLAAILVASTARAEEPAKPQLLPSQKTRHYATLIVAGVVAVNGGFTGGGLVGLCYEQERSKMSFEVCSAISVDNHLTLTGEVSTAVFRRWKRASLGGGLVAMSELAHEGTFVGLAPTVNLVIPVHHVVSFAAEVGGGPQVKVARGTDSRYPNPHEVGHVRGVAFGMFALVITLNP